MNLLDVASLDCTFDQFLMATDGHFTLSYDKIDSENLPTVSNKVNTWIESREKCLRACAKCENFNPPAHAQSIIRAFTLH